MAKRIDQFIDGALKDYSEWLISSRWRGKEHDCVNLFAMRFLVPAVGPSSTIVDPAQIRIEGAVPQPAHCRRPSARKDLVIWRNPLDVPWDEVWAPINIPWVVMEWKTRRSGRHEGEFSPDDVDWLTAFTKENPNALGYAVTVDFRASSRLVHRAKFRRGSVSVKRNLGAIQR